jgi:hypothetical protein
MSENPYQAPRQASAAPPARRKGIDAHRLVFGLFLGMIGGFLLIVAGFALLYLYLAPGLP